MEQKYFDHHRHLSGSIPVRTIVWLLNYRLSYEEIKNRIIIDKPVDFETFLKSFHIFDYIEWNEYKLYKSAQNAIDDVEDDNALIGANFICSTDKYNIPTETVFKIINDVSKMSKKNIILTWGIKYEKIDDECNILKNSNIADYITGINFISKENYLNEEKIKPIIEIAKSNKLSIGMHVGENSNGDNVRKAIDLGADIISHGTNTYQSDVKRILDMGLKVDVSIISNKLTSIINHPNEHAFYKYIDQDKIRLVSDDPVIFNNSIDREIKEKEEWDKKEYIYCR